MLSFIRQGVMFVAVLALPVHARAQATVAAASFNTPRDSAKVAAIREMLALTHASDLAIKAMETSLPAQRAANPMIPAVFWDRFLTQAKSRRRELDDLIIVVYDRHFTTSELRQLIAFYKTPIGRKLLDEQPAIAQESIIAGQAWGQKIGMEVGQQLATEGVKVP
jgi:uncharacterized protein